MVVVVNSKKDFEKQFHKTFLISNICVVACLLQKNFLQPKMSCWRANKASDKGQSVASSNFALWFLLLLSKKQQQFWIFLKWLVWAILYQLYVTALWECMSADNWYSGLTLSVGITSKALNLGSTVYHCAAQPSAPIAAAH